MGKHKDPKYAIKWYHRNKERLLADPKRRAAKKIRDKKDYLKHKEKRIASQKLYTLKNKEKIKKRAKEYYLKTREQRIEYSREMRAVPGYNEYVREYRKRNKDKINKQQAITAEKSIRKMVAAITDSYVVGQILCSPLNKLSRKELYANKELLEIKRGQILITRLKKKIKSYAKENSK